MFSMLLGPSCTVLFTHVIGMTLKYTAYKQKVTAKLGGIILSRDQYKDGFFNKSGFKCQTSFR